MFTTSIFTWLDFPFCTVNRVSVTSKPEGHGVVSSGSNRTGVLRSTGPVFSLHGILMVCPLGMVTSRFVVLTGQSSVSWLLRMKLTRVFESSVFSPVKAKVTSSTWRCRNSSPVWSFMISSMTLYPMSGISSTSSVTKKGTSSSLSGDDSLNLNSTHPLYGIFVPLAAVKFSSASKSSEMSLIGMPGSTLVSRSSDTMETWAPVSQSASR